MHGKFWGLPDSHQVLGVWHAELGIWSPRLALGLKPRLWARPIGKAYLRAKLGMVRRIVRTRSLRVLSSPRAGTSAASPLESTPFPMSCALVDIRVASDALHSRLDGGQIRRGLRTPLLVACPQTPLRASQSSESSPALVWRTFPATGAREDVHVPGVLELECVPLGPERVGGALPRGGG